MKKKRRLLLWFIVFLTLVSIYIDLPSSFPIKFSLGSFSVDTVFHRPDLNFKLGPLQIRKDWQIKRGLDLAGGAHLVFKADMNEIGA